MLKSRGAYKRKYGMRCVTRREKEIAILIAHGYSNDEIGRKLWITLDTVKRHISRIFIATGAKNRVQVAIWALKQGLVSLDDIRLPYESEETR